MEKLTLNTQEIRNLTGWGRIHIQRLVADGNLPNVGTAKRFLVSRTALMRYLDGTESSARLN
jgi:excisionase family DNA binding protein